MLSAIPNSVIADWLLQFAHCAGKQLCSGAVCSRTKLDVVDDQAEPM